MDWISNLPEPILHHILFFMPAKDAARTSVLSQTWLHTWKSLPNVTFKFESDAPIWEEEDDEEEEEKDRFLSFVDHCISVLSQQKVIIRCFKLDLRLCLIEYDSHIKKLLDMVSKNHVESIHICINLFPLNNQGVFQNPYSLPQTLFRNAGSLQGLNLEGCKITSKMFAHEPKFSSLRELTLLEVDLNYHALYNLLIGSPMLNMFHFHSIENGEVEFLVLCDNPELNEVTVTGYMRGVHIQVPHLETLSIEYTNGMELSMSGTVIREFTIYFTEYITNHIIQQLMSEIPKVEKLVLDDLPYFPTFEVSTDATSLQTSFLCAPPEKVMVNDAPNLCHYEYRGTGVLPLLYFDSDCLQEVHLNLSVSYDIGTKWFLDLRKSLEVWDEGVVLTLRIHSKAEKNTFMPMEFEEISTPPPSLNCLKVDVAFLVQDLDHAALLDGLFWCCHPSTLSVLPPYPDQNYIFIEFLCQELITAREENPVCCRGYRTFRCWRHYLKNVKVVAETGEGIKDLDDLHGNALYQSLLDLRGLVEVKFNLEW